METSLQRGDAVTVMWKGTPRHGVVTGEAHGDSLPTGARFIPVRMDDDGITQNVDSRLVALTGGQLVPRALVSTGMVVECPRSSPGAHVATVTHVDPVGTDPLGPRIVVSLTCGHTVNMSDGHGLYLARRQ